jgi:hypothetical protein
MRAAWLLALALASSPAFGQGISAVSSAADGKPGATGPQGPQGPAGPKASVFVCTTTLAAQQAVGVAAGVSEKSGIACSGALVTDILEVYPTTLPTGFAVHHALPTAANTLRVVFNMPAVAVLTNYTVPLSIYAVNR